jgi:hypothetical protein
MLAVLVLSLAVIAAGRAEIRETKSMQEVFAAVDTNTLLVLDIDNTLIHPAGQLGSDQWYYYLSRRLQQTEKLDERAAADKANDIWNKVQERIAVVPVETDSVTRLRALQDQGIKVLALTARSPDSRTITCKQLASAGYDLSRSTITTNKVAWQENGAIEFADGILMVGEHNSKGPALARFFKEVGYRPTRIVYADDRSKHTQSLEKVFGNSEIAFLGFRYGAADAKVQEFNDDTRDILLFVDGVFPSSVE